MPGPRLTSARVELSIEQVYAVQGRFVWATLSRLGVADKDLEDQVQEVFVVVHRRLDGFEGEASIRTWLWAICRRVASNYRRLASVRREQAMVDGDAEPIADSIGPERAAMEGEARAHLLAILDEMDIDKRAVFVMFEVELMGAVEIAEIVGVPVATVYSRLGAARKIFERAVSRAKWDLESKEKKR